MARFARRNTVAALASRSPVALGACGAWCLWGAPQAHAKKIARVQLWVIDNKTRALASMIEARTCGRCSQGGAWAAVLPSDARRCACADARLAAPNLVGPRFPPRARACVGFGEHQREAAGGACHPRHPHGRHGRDQRRGPLDALPPCGSRHATARLATARLATARQPRPLRWTTHSRRLNHVAIPMREPSNWSQPPSLASNCAQLRRPSPQTRSRT